MKRDEIALSNFKHYLSQNPYPGRGLVIGRSGEDKWLILYWIMGRSAQSRNRRFVVDGGILKTEPIDPGSIADPSLIIYEAMLDLPDIYLVSNGDQTRTMVETLQGGGTIEDALIKREHEPDAPHFTPRISGVLSFKGKTASMILSILKASPLDSSYTDRFFYRPSMPAVGFGFGLTTYLGDGNPLPSFSGEPLLLPCHDGAEEILERYWNALNLDNRIAIAAKEISDLGRRSEIFIRNR
ncbi:MAG: inosine monophosphate cyclohydrolase [Deltaproteobacteria bacterium]|nr:inosine monophosphate cyclohydrolase [Deltaproteobacteria bacterium]